jgi:hypothetical protein
MDRGDSLLLRDARRYFDRPHESLHERAIRDIGPLSVNDRTGSLDLTGPERDVLTAFWTLNFNAPAADGAFTQALRWCSATSGYWQLMNQACSTYKLQDGTRALAEAMANDMSADLVRLGCYRGEI